jgi:low temperature requirement protein LtrA
MTAHGPLLRRGTHRVSNAELFYDLVYVFAVTQLSHWLLDHLDWGGAARAALLLALVWQAWAYTTWVTNWLDPELIPVRLMLLALSLASLVLSAGIPDAFGSDGMLVGGAYAGMQIGRSLFAVGALRGAPDLQRNFERILAWCLVSGTLAIVGGLVHGHARELLWLAAVSTDVIGSLLGFATPLLGRARTTEWQIDGAHFAERCQAFILIALGESVVVTGATFADDKGGTAEAAAFITAFVAAAALWWLYFDRSADAGALRVAASDDPGRLGRSAYHLIHPIMVAGVIVLAAADERVLAHPTGTTDVGTRWLVLGGAALFLAGHALFKATVWRTMPTTRIIGIVVLALLGLLAPHVSALTLSICVAGVLVLVAMSDRLTSDGLRASFGRFPDDGQTGLGDGHQVPPTQ